MGVGGETAFWRVTYDRGCAGDLVSDPIKHPSIDAHNWRGYPLDLSAMNHDAPGKIGINVGHDAVSSTDDGLTDRVAYFFYRFFSSMFITLPATLLQDWSSGDGAWASASHCRFPAS